MVSGKSKTPDLKVRPSGMTVLGKIDENAPFSQALPGARHDEAPSSGSLNVSMKSEGKNVVVSRIRDTAKNEDVDLDKLMKHMTRLLKLREKGQHEQAHSLGHFSWPDVPGLQRLKQIVSSKINRSIDLLDKALEASSRILKEIGRANVAIAAPLVVDHTLKTCRIKKSEKRWRLIKGMHDLAIGLKRSRESADGMHDVMQEATLLIIEGALMCSTEVARFTETGPPRSIPPEENAGGIIAGFVSVEDLKHFIQRLKAISLKIKLRITAIEPQGRSHLSKGNAIHADNGQVEEDLLLTVQQEVDINTGQVEEDPLVPEPQKAYIHNNEQVEEDPLVPERQKAYIHNNDQVEEDLVFTERQKAHIHNEQVEEDLPVPELQNSHIHNNEQVEEDLLSSGSQKVFKMEALVDATNNFDEHNKVGEGGFGAVYKGITDDGTQIAVKKMSFTDEGRRESMKKQFENEKLLAEFQHRNLVKLLGSCEQESQGFLVYEYLPKGSLDRLLFDADKRKELDWKKRYNIIVGVARGLLYLHQDSRLRTVHRDIKASNILLDEELNPKIGDFGAAKLFPENMTHITTTGVGTFGYWEPDYLMTGKLSPRADVYSFGIFLLELVTGEKISSDALKLSGWVWSSYKRNLALQTIDPTIIETWYKEKEKALRCIEVGLSCIQEDSSLRPTMSEVTAMLPTFESFPVPTKPPFQPSTA